jgi:uncharacterized protein DUF4143
MILQLGIQIPAVALRRFWNMLAYYHAQIWNGAELARALAVSESTVRRYLDILMLFKHGRRLGVECKRMDAPTLTPSMRIALNDLKLDRLVVVYPGDRRYALADRVEVVPLVELVDTGGDAARVFKKRR